MSVNLEGLCNFFGPHVNLYYQLMRDHKVLKIAALITINIYFFKLDLSFFMTFQKRMLISKIFLDMQNYHKNA